MRDRTGKVGDKSKRKEEGAIILICDTLYQPNINGYKFSIRYFIGLPRYYLHNKSL